MSDLTKAGFVDGQAETGGVAVQFIDNVAEDAILEMVVDGERKFGAVTTLLLPVKSGTSSADSFEITSAASQTVINVANSPKCTVVVRHAANDSAATCKIIPVGVIDGVGIVPLEELSFAASVCYTYPDSKFYYSYAQQFDTKGFNHIMFLVSELSAGNFVYVWAGPAVGGGGE